MKIYCSSNGNWYQTSFDLVTWGRNNIPMSRLVSQSTFSLKVTTDTSTIFPLVGILAGNSSTKPFSGNESAFKRIQLALQQSGGLSFVFTPSSFDYNWIKGYVFDFKDSCWKTASFPLPNVVYNRVPLRKHEQNEDYQTVKNLIHSLQLPYFNDCFFHKEEMFRILSQNKQLLPFLPITKKLATMDEFLEIIDHYQSVYIKPSKGKKGKGIVWITKKSDDDYDLVTINKQVTNIRYDKLKEEWIEPLLEKEFIVQQYITPLLWKGARFDYRVLVHRKNENEFIVSGIGVRQSRKQQVTTHVPAGGNILPFSSLPFSDDAKLVEFLAQEIGKTLLYSFKHIGEFSMDIGKAEDGNLYVFEVNSKPMVFDEDDIRRNGLQHLIKLFIYLSRAT